MGAVAKDLTYDNWQILCAVCDGVGWHGVAPEQPSPFRPGGDEHEKRLGVLAARYRAGLPLWNAEDFKAA